MIPYNLSDSAIAEVFAKTQKMSLTNRLLMFQEYKAFYERDLEQIKYYLKIELEKHYTAETLNLMRWQHKDIIQKILRLKTGGLYDNEPERKLESGDFDLKPFLKTWKYNQKIEDLSRRSIFFNTVLAHAIKRGNKIDIDLITGESCVVIPDDEDYLKLSEVYLRRTDSEGDLYVSYWNESEHYIIDSRGNKLTTYKGIKLVNKAKVLPFGALHYTEGIDFWGEPNSNMLQSQKEFDISLTNLSRLREYQGFGVWIATNLDLDKNERISPNKIFNLTNVKTDMQKPSLECVVPGVNFEALMAVIDWERKLTLLSEGISSSAGSLDIQSNSGVSKWMDEIETQIQREQYKIILKQFEEEFIKILIKVHNSEFSGNKIPVSDVNIKYSDDIPTETIGEKIERKKFYKENYVEDEVDIIMQEKELDEVSALTHLMERMKRKKMVSANDEQEILNSLLNPEVKPVKEEKEDV